jgi:hypothetical protein
MDITRTIILITAAFALSLSVGTREMSAGSQVSPDRNCSTDVVLAVFFKGRSCDTGTLIVAASSKFNSRANLEVSDYGPMKWDSESQMWFIRIRNLEATLGVVTVVGAECTAQAEIAAVTFGCDARLPYDAADKF